MKSHFDPQITAPLPLEDDESEAEATVTSADKPVKRPLWDQPKIQIAALAIFAILGLTWKMSGSCWMAFLRGSASSLMKR